MELLIEIFSEEIPARMQRQAKVDFLALFCKEFTALKLPYQQAEVFVGPRRLVLHVANIAERSADLIEEKRGPKVGAPEAAFQGFLKSCAISAEQTYQENGYWLAKITQPGKSLIDLLPGIIDRVIRGMPWPTSMRWPGAEHTWVRPIRNICCVLAGKAVIFKVPAAGITTNNQTFGHRFLSPKPITVIGFSQYRKSLENAFVMLDLNERYYTIQTEIFSIAPRIITDETLLDEVAGLVEYPFVGRGDIDNKFMSLPSAVLSTSMRVHQKYFTFLDKESNVEPFFAYVANVPINIEYMQKGYETVLRARLSDAAFFYEQDLKIPFASRLEDLKSIVFHNKLGSIYQKVKRLEHCTLNAKVKQAASLSKCDLTTTMVGEFPELQGYMGEIYSKAQGTDPKIAEAIRDYHRPQGANDTCPVDEISWTLSLLDKVDSLVGFLGIGMQPSGSKDPYGLRRNALGIIRLMLAKQASNNLRPLLEKSLQSYKDQHITLQPDTLDLVINFITERLSAFLKTEMPADHVYAVLNQPLEDIWRTVELARTLRDLLQTQVGAALLSTHRRATGILKGINLSEVNPDLLVIDVEKILLQALVQTTAKIKPLLASFAFKEAMELIADLKPLIDSFFDNVKVMDDNLHIRQNRLNLLGTLQSTLNTFANFAKLES